KRGFCANCHAPHGWPDNLTPANDFPKLLVERADLSDTKGDPDSAENLCYTCHDDGPAKGNIMADFAKAVHHPIKDAEQVAGRSVECRDCHNVHKAQSGSHVYTTVATSARNLVSNVLKGVSGLS
ncbi:MAG: hypothetical protein NTU83_04815, partial [Candidatus Hydrogenedentes bacterium]|nr:hypothetical protein [Candidatus Hydrogenedentota bacterium]